MRWVLVAASLAALAYAKPLWALDKQGSAHGGDVGAGSDGFGVTGALVLGTSIINNSYAARPDNTGLALMRYAGHADIDLLGRALSIPLDVNMFSDKTRDGFENFAAARMGSMAEPACWKICAPVFPGPSALRISR